ncbi:hypothetical protein LCGC14_0356070 [marine sediment metagenome]|uniref:Uncharacterized protein n=1 Tax=marine sediment metagenome TaxID=412755 RepID=A0A0F9T9I4_9ZZZZ
MNLPTPKEAENTMALKKLRVKILTVFRTLVDPEFTAPLGKPQYKSSVYQFGDLLTLPDPDTGRLSYWTGTDRAVKPKKVDCVLAIVSCVVAGYWHLVNGEEAVTPVIEKRLDQLDYIVEHWDELKVIGNIREQYYLAGIPELEETTPDLTEVELEALDDLTGEELEDEQVKTEQV